MSTWFCRLHPLNLWKFQKLSWRRILWGRVEQCETPWIRSASKAGVNFANILQAAFVREDPKSAIKLLNLTVFFAFLGSERVKAALRMLVKLTPAGVNFANILQAAFAPISLH